MLERRDRRGRRIGANWWREWIVSEWFLAHHAWEQAAEYVSCGYATELREYTETHPRPTLKEFMVGLSNQEV